MKDAYYFPHDSNARNDPKMPALKLKYKAAGIGMYWIFIEILRDQEEFKYLIDSYSWESLASEFMTTPEKAEQFISDCINKFKLLKSDGKYIWSNSLLKRMQKMLDERVKRSAAGKKGMQSRWGDKSSENNSVITPPNNDITPHNKGKESKEKESKGKESKKTLKTFLIDSWEFKFASALKGYILKNNPTAKVPTDLQPWANGFDKVLGIDKRDISEVCEVLLFSQTDDFWKTNILSPRSFRKHYDTLKMQWVVLQEKQK